MRRTLADEEVNTCRVLTSFSEIQILSEPINIGINYSQTSIASFSRQHSSRRTPTPVFLFYSIYHLGHVEA